MNIEINTENGNFKFPNQTNFYRGKVRDVYTIDDKYLLMITTDRISAFDVILKEPIPYKGQILNQIATKMLEEARSVCPVWLTSSPLPNVSVGKKCVPYQIEMIVRGNLSGGAWRDYRDGKREKSGVTLPEGMQENQFFPSPIVTPTTKSTTSHDEDISVEEIIQKGLVVKTDMDRLIEYSLKLFELGQKIADARGLILVDTKYEFGVDEEGIITLIDEIHTPDSSRYFYKKGFEERLRAGHPQKQLSKEFVREELMDKGFTGKDGQTIPELSDDFINSVTERYIELYEILMGNKFIPRNYTDKEIYTACINEEKFK